ncbi:spermatogenesis-associated protein 31-like [Meriones unguiculatus]|uniref:spermatogenesis-associated protein 31-like n=1 Tax=Meriones unguiculatus TaxID=10047 RepID=UPI000B4F1CBD|nr:spermatogenesis-associated protein 31-like [Meriones unguiculatus]
MENLSSLLESIYSTWLSLSSTLWAMDMILAFVGGLGLYLLLLPFLESHLSASPPNIKFTRKPQMKMTWQSQHRKKFRNHCRSHAKAWGECLKKLQGKEKDGLFLEEMGSGHHLNSLGNMLNSSSARQDSTALLPFWKLRGESEQQMSTQKLSNPKIWGDHFQQKYNQLFWGLPSLHSESLVATAWIPQTASALPSPFFLFNVISGVYPVQFQDKLSPMLSHTFPLSYLDLRSPPFILSSSQFQPQTLTQVHLQSPLPSLLPSSLPYTRDYGTSCSQSQCKPPYLPTELQYRERPLLTRQPESRLSLPQVCDVSTPSLTQDWAVSMFPDSIPISCELREKLEQHIQKWLLQHRWDLPCKTQESLEVMQRQNTATNTCQASFQPSPSQSSVSSGEYSKEGQKVRVQPEKETGKNLGPILGKISKDPVRGLYKPPRKVQWANISPSERNPVKCLESNSRNDTIKYIAKNPENSLKTHLSLKSGQIHQGLIPLNVRRSWLVISDGFARSPVSAETRNVTSPNCLERSMSSPQKLAFLDPGTRQTLEAHIVRFWVRHKWGLPLKMLKPINLFKLKNVESLPIASRAQPFSTTSSVAEVVRFLGKPSQRCLREMLKDSSSSAGSCLLVSPPSYKNIDRALRRLPSGVDHKPLKVLPTKPESRHLSETLTHNFMATTSESEIVLEKERETQEVFLLPRRTSVQSPGPHSLQAQVVSKLPCNVKTEPAAQPQTCATAVLLPECSRSRVPADTSAPCALGDTVGVEGRKSFVQQKTSTPKHQVSEKDLIKLLASTCQDEDTKRQSEGNHEEKSKFSRVKEKEDNFRSKYHQPVPNTTQVLPQSTFQRLVSRFLQWLQPKKTMKAQETPPPKFKPTATTAQSQQKQVRKGPHVDSNVAEAQELMTAVGQMLEKKMMLQRKLCASKFNQHKQFPPAHPYQFSQGHKPGSYTEQMRAPSHPANLSQQNYCIQDRHTREQLSQKNVRFSNEPQSPQNLGSSPHNAPLNLVNFPPNRIIVPAFSGHHLHCPRHCALRRSICSQLENSSFF